MKKFMLGTTVMVGLASPVFAATLNSIAIDDTAGQVGTLSIIQDDSAGNSTNTVSGDGTSGAGAPQLPISGPWSTIAITQTGKGNTLKGAITSSSTGSVTANYTTTSTGANVHSLTIGQVTAPAAPSVTIFVKNNGTSGNAITDTLDGATLTHNLGLLGKANSLTNNVSAGAGGITLTEGGSAYGIASSYRQQLWNSAATATPAITS